VKSLYQDIRNKLETDISGIHVRLWNNQILYSDEGQQIPFNFPAVFIDFPVIEWGQMGKGIQNADRLVVRLYICSQSYNTSENEEDLEIFDLRENVFYSVQDLKPTDAGKLQRVAEQTDPKHTNIYVWVMDFITNYQDRVAENPRNSQEATIETLTLTTDLQIDPNTVDGVRTDKEFD